MADEKRPDSWIAGTGQTWKVSIFYVLATMTLCLVVAKYWWTNHPNSLLSFFPNLFTVALWEIGLGTLTACWLCLSIRCPACKRTVVIKVLNNSTAGNCFTVLTSLTACPHCGFSGKKPT